MNERIKELIKQSYVWVKLPETLYKADDDVEGFLDFDKKKFAELIIRECVELCQKCVDDGCVEAEEPLSKILEHFGVEEK